jgi:hypothetical protein
MVGGLLLNFLILNFFNSHFTCGGYLINPLFSKIIMHIHLLFILITKGTIKKKKMYGMLKSFDS